jgi:hypothetical protein
MRGSPKGGPSLFKPGVHMVSTVTEANAGQFRCRGARTEFVSLIEEIGQVLDAGQIRSEKRSYASILRTRGSTSRR